MLEKSEFTADNGGVHLGKQITDVRTGQVWRPGLWQLFITVPRDMGQAVIRSHVTPQCFHVARRGELPGRRDCLVGFGFFFSSSSGACGMGLPFQGVYGILGFGELISYSVSGNVLCSTQTLRRLNHFAVKFVNGYPAHVALAFCRYALHFLVQTGISYCIMIIIGVENMHK